ncbi:MsnO8 family LLM class oxidoreductase [Gulosibacter sediminis]|uniref:MsnO8 family LLM class oxidoreductase n=1 Tax=Gulosibacter sediminis TaxID=1729695 RepID=UPI0018663F7B|nr:MsnO8 family LLM class oxidoreductase [Gulosibacter sediminis]
MQISLLDRTRTRVGDTDAQTVAATVDRAVRADELGFDGFWVAEHHSVPGIASATPGLLLASIGAHTRCIRLGTGGIMVPNHRPLVIAEQAALLEALHPGRVDLGLGGSLGFIPAVREALGRMRVTDEEYRNEIAQVRALVRGGGPVRTMPRVAAPPIYLLAIRGGLTLAAELGLPVIVGGSLLDNAEALEAYRSNYVPSEDAPEPRLIANVDVMIASTRERARELLLPEAWALADSRNVGEFRALQPVEEVHRLRAAAGAKLQQELARQVRRGIAGTADDVAERLEQLVARTGAEGLLVSSSTFDREAIAATDEALAALLT